MLSKAIYPGFPIVEKAVLEWSPALPLLTDLVSVCPAAMGDSLQCGPYRVVLLNEQVHPQACALCQAHHDCSVNAACCLSVVLVVNHHHQPLK